MDTKWNLKDSMRDIVYIQKVKSKKNQRESYTEILMRP